MNTCRNHLAFLMLMTTLGTCAAQATSGTEPGTEPVAEVGSAPPAQYQGEFKWEDEGKEFPGEVRVVFKPGDSEGVYDATFNFVWEGEAYEWYGELQGSLEAEMQGKVTSKIGREPSFRLEGSFEKGRYTGRHYRIKSDGSERYMGTLELETSELETTAAD